MSPRLFLITTLLLASIGALHAANTPGAPAAAAGASHSLADLQSLLGGGAGPGTVSPNSAAGSGGVSALPVLNVPSTPAPSPPPRASKDSKTFRLVEPVPCNETVAQSLMVGYQKNRAIFDECVVKCKYQIFPFTGELPTPVQITAQAIAPACTAVFTGVLLSGIPECDVSSMALKSVVETLLKITVDIREGLPCPDSQQFFNLIIWRRDSNLAQAAGLPYDSHSKLYAEYTRNLWKSLTTYSVQISSDQTISYDSGNATKSSSGSASGRLPPSVGSGKAVSPSSGASDSINTSTKSGGVSSIGSTVSVAALVAMQCHHWERAVNLVDWMARLKWLKLREAPRTENKVVVVHVHSDDLHVSRFCHFSDTGNELHHAEFRSTDFTMSAARGVLRPSTRWLPLLTAAVRALAPAAARAPRRQVSQRAAERDDAREARRLWCLLLSVPNKDR